MNNTVAIICSKMRNLNKFFNKSLKKMLTESCVMFSSLSRAVLSAILRDEYSTSIHSRLNFQMKPLLGWTVFSSALVCWQIKKHLVSGQQLAEGFNSAIHSH